MDNIVSFPGFGWELHFSSVAFHLGAKPVYWYGIIIMAGFLLALLYATRRAPQFGVKRDDIGDLAIIALPICIVCARIYYVIFEWQYYKSHPGEIIAIWHGGLAIYGGIIGAVITCLIFCRIRKIYPLDIMDVGCLGLLIGQSIGRWGNFMNCEAFGGVTTAPWRMCIGRTLEQCGATGNHPTFFYESAWNALGLLLLHCFSKSKGRKYRGEVTLLYFVWYGLGRFWIEGLRTDSLYLIGTGLRVSQLVAATSFVVGLVLLLVNRKKPFLRPVSAEDARNIEENQE